MLLSEWLKEVKTRRDDRKVCKAGGTSRHRRERNGRETFCPLRGFIYLGLLNNKKTRTWKKEKQLQSQRKNQLVLSLRLRRLSSVSTTEDWALFVRRTFIFLSRKNNYQRKQIAKHKSGRRTFRSPNWFVLCDLQIFSGGVYPPSATSRTISFSISNSFWYYTNIMRCPLNFTDSFSGLHHFFFLSMLLPPSHKLRMCCM